MQNKLVFYLAEYPAQRSIDPLKVVYLERHSYWKQHKCLSGQSIDIPLNLQYHLHIKGEIADQIFEITNPSITEQDFINSGFIKDPSFESFIKFHEIIR